MWNKILFNTEYLNKTLQLIYFVVLLFRFGIFFFQLTVNFTIYPLVWGIYFYFFAVDN